MPLQKLQFKPGIVSDVTSYSNEGGYVDGDKIRFRLGFPEKIGGWLKYSANIYQGAVRSLHNWIALDGSNYLSLGYNIGCGFFRWFDYCSKIKCRTSNCYRS